MAFQGDYDEDSRDKVKSIGRDDGPKEKRDEYSLTAQIEAMSNELGVLQDMISQAEKKFGPVLVGDDEVEADKEGGMDRRMNSRAVEAIIANRDFVRAQTRRLMYMVERAQI